MMKKLMIVIFLLTAFLQASVGFAASIKAEVNGMVCAFCAKGIEKKLNAMPEAKGAFVNLKRRIVVLELKEQQDVPLTTFEQVITDAGYTISKVQKVEQSIEAIKTEMKANP
jgi:cation transport ATPase